MAAFLLAAATLEVQTVNYVTAATDAITFWLSCSSISFNVRQPACVSEAIDRQ